MDKMCENCKFLFREEPYEITRTIIGESKSECRRFPPLPIMVNNCEDNPKFWHVYPSVNTEDWCGEYKNKTKIRKVIYGN